MSDLAMFLQDVLYDGRMHFRAPPAREPEERARAVLEPAYHSHRLCVAGTPVPFDAATVLAAARVLQHAGWYLLHPLQPIADESMLQMPLSQSPAQHLSADLLLRLVPALLRRARALAADDVLPRALTLLLRQWPLSGVLADIDDGPLTPLDFDGHAGLMMLYAERLAAHVRLAWFPTGPAAAYVELVWQQLGKDPTRLATLAATRAGETHA